MFILRRTRVANFATLEIATILIKKNLKDSNEVERIRNYVLKWNLYLYFFI